MPIKINGRNYYRTAEACKIAGISKSTFFRWLKEGSFTDVINSDRRGWRLFTPEDLKRLQAEANQVKPVQSKPAGKRPRARPNTF